MSVNFLCSAEGFGPIHAFNLQITIILSQTLCRTICTLEWTAHEIERIHRMSTAADFEAAAAHAASPACTGASNEQKIRLYGLFKQAKRVSSCYLPSWEYDCYPECTCAPAPNCALKPHVRPQPNIYIAGRLR